MSIREETAAGLAGVATVAWHEPAEHASRPRAHATARPAPERLWNLPGIAGTTRVSTSFGDLPAQVVRRNDPLRVHGGTHLPVLEVREYKLDPGFLASRPDAAPIRVHGARFGGGAPDGDILLSPGQLLLDGEVGEGIDAPLARASDLPDRIASRSATTEQISYFVFRLPGPALIHAQGMWLFV
jgi:hypothetical protein